MAVQIVLSGIIVKTPCKYAIHTLFSLINYFDNIDFVGLHRLVINEGKYGNTFLGMLNF